MFVTYTNVCLLEMFFIASSEQQRLNFDKKQPSRYAFRGWQDVDSGDTMPAFEMCQVPCPVVRNRAYYPKQYFTVALDVKILNFNLMVTVQDLYLGPFVSSFVNL